MTQIPYDPVILLSFVNMKLRDRYPDLHALCDDLEADEESIEKRLLALDYHYDPKQNQFV